MDNQEILKEDLDKLEKLFNKAESNVGNIETDTRFGLSYPETITDFMLYLSNSVWNDFNYNPTLIGNKIKEPDYIENADIVEIRSVLTWIHRTEYFSDGHWQTVMESDLLPKIIDRLKILV